MDLLNETLQWVQNVGFVLVAVWALLRWSRRREPASRWMAATFASLGLVVTVGTLLDALPTTLATGVVERLVIAVLVLFPYLLLRFLDSFESVPGVARRTVGTAVLALALTALVIPLPAAGEPRNAWFQVYALLVVACWIVVLPLVAARFWRAGTRQPTVARRRLRLLAIGSVSLSAAVLVVGVFTTPDEVTVLATNVLAVGAALALLLGFAPPAALRRTWRRPEEDELHEAALGLMAATSEHEVARVLIPHVRAVVAARGVALVRGGRVLSTEGVSHLEAIGALRASPPEVLTSELSDGALHVWTDRFTPFFGDDELLLFERVGLLADLALDRVALLASEREARIALERANAELESFVYSASHDLKSPLIAMLGYVDLLSEEHGDLLDGEARWYLERMGANGRYMEELIHDLLELSRVGRLQTAPDRVEVSTLLGDVARELEHRHPGLHVELGDLPVLEVNEVRLRQLFTNLLENAVTHGAHGASDEVTVTVTARPTDDEPGATVISVHDDGPGVPVAYRELVFGVFERLQGPERPGTGIGLAICRKIMESVGGCIRLADHDDGAEFRLLFPATTVATPTATTPEEAHA